MRWRLILFVAILTIIPAASFCLLGWWLDWSHDPMETLPWLHGRPRTDVIAELGEPSGQWEYAMADCPGGEFRVELYNTYPPNDPVAARARIVEMQWNRPRYHVCVWLHLADGEWVVLDTCRWKEGVVF